MKKIKNAIFDLVRTNLYAIVIFSLFLGLEIFELDYSVYSPGGLINVDERIDNKQYTANGSFNMTYVSYRKGSLINLIIAKIMPTFDIVKNEDITMSNEDITDAMNRDNIQIMEAVSNATLIAYNKAGKDIEVTNEYDYIYYIDPSATSELKVGDRVLACDNKETTNYSDIITCVQDRDPGNTVDLKVKRGSREITTTSKLREDGIIGVIIKRVFTFDLNPKMSYKYDKKESGSSGGLMLSLALYNSLVEEDITKGMKIAGTGTIELDGTVGEISGIQYKIKGAVKNKVDLMIVPEENYEEAEQVIKDNNFNLKLMKATTFDQVVEDLKNYN